MKRGEGAGGGNRNPDALSVCRRKTAAGDTVSHTHVTTCTVSPLGLAAAPGHDETRHRERITPEGDWWSVTESCPTLRTPWTVSRLCVRQRGMKARKVNSNTQSQETVSSRVERGPRASWKRHCNKPTQAYPAETPLHQQSPSSQAHESRMDVRVDHKEN